jgi:RimJ/RimL family protein N-acetyltransferase
MNIAFCIRGMCKEYTDSYENLYLNIINDLEKAGHKLTFFLNTDTVQEPFDWNEFFYKFKPAKVHISGKRMKPGQDAMYYVVPIQCHECIELVEKHEKEQNVLFDQIIITRYDISFSKTFKEYNIDFEKLNMECRSPIWENGGYNSGDNFFLIPRKYLSPAKEAFLNIVNNGGHSHQGGLYFEYWGIECHFIEGETTETIPDYNVMFRFTRYDKNKLRIQRMTIEDVPFVNSIRNLYCADFLHNSRTFTDEQALSWFITSNPEFYIISIDNERIGYFRTSNHSKENRNIYIGADIHPAFTGRGLGHKAYKEFMFYLFNNKDNLNKISLEVLATNTRAIHLYKKLGFVQEGCKREEVLKGDTYVDSIVMSILKKDFLKH